jgi:hypothetical protein
MSRTGGNFIPALLLININYNTELIVTALNGSGRDFFSDF